MTTPPPPEEGEGGGEGEDHDDDEISGYNADDGFFESFDRINSSVYDLAAASSSSETEDDGRMSFASAVGGPCNFRRLVSSASIADLSSVAIDEESDDDDDDDDVDDYSVWMSAPMSIEERRRRLFKGMGLSSSSKNADTESPREVGEPSSATGQPSTSSTTSGGGDAGRASTSDSPKPCPSALIRARSDTAAVLADKDRRKGNLLGGALPPSIPRASSLPNLSSSSHKTVVGLAAAVISQRTISRRMLLEGRTRKEGGAGKKGRSSNGDDPVAFYTIRNLDTGKEFVINMENGAWNSRLSDLQTGVQLTMDEFERSVGHSPILNELLRREYIGPGSGAMAMKTASKKKGVNWLKNIRGVANSVTGLVLEREGSSLIDRFSGRTFSSSSSAAAAASTSSDWMKVHRRGKPYKELTGLYMSQEILAHEGSIWCMRFSADANFMASAGEDRLIHVWQVIECDAGPSSRRNFGEMGDSGPSGDGSPDRPQPTLEARPSATLKRGKTFGSKKRSLVPDYVVVPEAIFSLSERPVCTFKGHLDDVLDLSWSKSQYLLSSSMDKTVRLWDMDTQSCLKLFAHNDYVTCIQFNPVDDRYFISGSLDAKVRVWSIPDRQVIDWNDLHEMVTAACYTPDGQGALVGSHKGSCRFYDMSDCKLNQKAQIDLYNKKKKSQVKKITGFQFSPGNPSEVLITSADSQIRIFDGVDLVHKFRGFRNTSSQISASFTPDSNYVVCASEDSHVYVWKREESRCGGNGKRAYVSTRSYENFQCKDVSVAIPWPGSSRYESPQPPIGSSSSFASSRFSHPSPMRSPDNQPQASSASIASASQDDSLGSSGRSSVGMPPLPTKKDKGSSSPDRAALSEDDLRNPSRSSSGLGSAFSGSSSWLKSGPLSSISALSISSSALSSRWIGGSSRSNTPTATAWGLVVVTAAAGGEIRVYQNFGLPLRLRQTNILR